jgi:hypothetical protein
VAHHVPTMIKNFVAKHQNLRFQIVFPKIIFTFGIEF